MMPKRGETVTFADLPVGARFVFPSDFILSGRLHVKVDDVWASIGSIKIRMKPEWRVQEVTEG
jgi:hypothetical protein